MGRKQVTRVDISKMKRSVDCVMEHDVIIIARKDGLSLFGVEEIIEWVNRCRKIARMDPL
jgi:hypothetical protein